MTHLHRDLTDTHKKDSVSDTARTKRRAPPAKIASIVALRAAGHTQASISVQTGLSVRTIRRILKRHPVRCGEAQAELVEQARRDLEKQFTKDEDLRSLYAQLAADTYAQITLAREKSAELLEYLEATDASSAALAFRALAAHAVATKTHTDTVRHLFPSPDTTSEDLPEITWREMTKEDMQQLREQQVKELAIIDGTHGPKDKAAS